MSVATAAPRVGSQAHAFDPLTNFAEWRYAPRFRLGLEHAAMGLAENWRRSIARSAASRMARDGGPYVPIAKKLAMSGAGALISTTTDSSMASMPCRTPLGWRHTSPGPRMYSSEPTVDFTLPLTT